MALEILAVGVPRTGTSSLKAALNTLGFGGCMHMDELFNQPHLVDYWIELYETGTTDFDVLFDGYRSSTDFPGCFQYEPLRNQYPDLKVILNYRDPASWYESMMKTVYPTVPKTAEAKAMLAEKGKDNPRFLGIAKTLALVEVYLLNRHYGGDFLNREKTIATYLDHCERVRREVPAGQLLEWEVSQGWEPLCAFLGVPVPEEDFPFKNKRADFQAQLGKMLSGGGKLTIK